MKFDRSVIIIFFIFSIYNVSCKSKNTVNSNVAFNSILEKCNANDTSLIYKLDTILNFKWDRMVILTPYFNREFLENCTNVQIPLSNLENTESTNEYLFIENKTITKYVISDNNGQEKIILTYHNINNVQKNKLTCGIENSPNLFIKLIPNENSEWSGKTFLIFTK